MRRAWLQPGVCLLHHRPSAGWRNLHPSLPRSSAVRSGQRKISLRGPAQSGSDGLCSPASDWWVTDKHIIKAFTTPLPCDVLLAIAPENCSLGSLVLRPELLVLTEISSSALPKWLSRCTAGHFRAARAAARHLPGKAYHGDTAPSANGAGARRVVSRPAGASAASPTNACSSKWDRRWVQPAYQYHGARWPRPGRASPGPAEWQPCRCCAGLAGAHRVPSRGQRSAAGSCAAATARSGP